MKLLTSVVSPVTNYSIKSIKMNQKQKNKYIRLNVQQGQVSTASTIPALNLALKSAVVNFINIFVGRMGKGNLEILY